MTDTNTSAFLPIDEFYEAVRGLKRILPSRKSDMPVDTEQGVQVTVTEDGVKVWGVGKIEREGLTQIEFEIDDADVISPGHFTFPVRPIVKPIRKLKKKADDLQLEAEGDTLKLDAGVASFEEDLLFHGDSQPSEISTLETVESGKTEVEYEEFERSIEQIVLGADSEADKRRYLRDVLFRTTEDKVGLFTSDGSIVAKSTLDWECDEFSVYCEKFDPILKIASKDEFELSEQGDVFQVDQGQKTFKVEKSDRDFPAIEKKIPKWESGCDTEIQCPASGLKEGIDFMDALPYDDEKIRIMATRSPVTLKGGRTSEKDSSFQIQESDKDLKFPTCQVKRAYLKDILKNVDKKSDLTLSSANDDDVPLILSQGKSRWYVMKFV